MSVVGKRRFRSVVETAIADKDGVKEITAETVRSDAAAILESVVAEFDEQDILDAMAHQGFEAKAYRSTLVALIKVAKERRSQRQAGRKAKGQSKGTGPVMGPS